MAPWISCPCKFFMVLICFCLEAGYCQKYACHTEEWEALNVLRANLHDPNGLLESWGKSSNCCEWRGLHCNTESGRVESVDLGGFNLSTTKGKLHPALFQLRELKYLDLSMNSFHGIGIPPNISLLQGLTFLNLSNSGFAGVVPLQLGEVSKLRYLDFSSLEILRIPSLTWLRNLTEMEYISLSGIHLNISMTKWGESVGNLRRLKHLDMTNCGLSGSIPVSLRNLTLLRDLHMENNRIDSRIPSWLFNMSNLVSINLRFNLLNGTMPVQLLLPNLTRMDLSVNQLTGTIPSAIENLTSLTYLDLGNNEFYGLIPPSISNLSFLKFLRLRYNALKGNIPYSLSKLDSLTYLDLSMDNLNGSVPDSIGQMTSLETLFIWGNQFQGTVTETLFQNLTNLQYLILTNTGLSLKINRDWVPPFQLSLLFVRSCNIEGPIPKWISHQSQVEHIDLSTNGLVETIPSWISNASYKLQNLNLSDNHLHGSIPSLALQHELTILDLSRNDFDGDIADYIGTNLPSSLVFLSMSNNKLTGSIPTSMCFLQRMEKLDLSNNRLTNSLPSSLGNCSSLNVLTLTNNKLEGAIPEDLGNLSKLQSLDLSGNRLSGPIPAGLANCKQLEILDLGENNLTGRLPNWIANLTNLRVLVLRLNKFCGPIPPTIFHLPRLQIIDLSSNNFSGIIPHQIIYLNAMTAIHSSIETYGRYFIAYEMYYQKGINITNKGNELDYASIPSAFTVIDFSANNLWGEIPVDIGKLKGLITLTLSNNHLDGHIPLGMGEILVLESLDLSHNQLNGEIPATLQLLDFLGYLNLSYNNLSGRIPQQRHFDTFGESSFWGNTHLCGFQLNKSCTLQRRNPASKEEHNDDEEEQEISLWKSKEFIKGIALGFSLAFGGVCIFMQFSMRWAYIDSG